MDQKRARAEYEVACAERYFSDMFQMRAKKIDETKDATRALDHAYSELLKKQKALSDITKLRKA